MNYKTIAVCCALSLGAIEQVSAIEVAGKKLEIYGKAHLSIDGVDADDKTSTINDGLSISSNSSRLGFKGELPAGNMKFIFQYEQEVTIDETGKELATRNTFAGLKGSYGKFIVGHHDTPFKTVASKWGVFGDSVGERRAMLGAGYKSGNQLNERAKNAMMYEFKTKSLKFQVMHAVDPEAGNDGKYDNTDKSVTSIAVVYKAGPIGFAIANEQWKQHSKMDNGSALRIAAKYKINSAIKVGLIYESIESDTVDEWKRDAMGLNAVYNISKNTDIRAQYIKVNSAKNVVDTGATKVALGVFHKLDKKAQLYLAYGSTSNDSGAKFQAVDGGHGDEVKTVNGGSPKAVSVGMVYKF